MIELADVTKVYPMGATEVRALNGVSLRIEPGEFVAIVGPSGSGKSTMMHLVGCLDRPTSGSYRLLDQTVSSLNDRQLARIRNRSIGFVFQTFNLISRMSAWENVAVALFYARRRVTKPQALAALDRVGLADRATHLPNELSGGERQRVAIARAIVNDPRLILADEPTGNLDTRTGEQIMDIFHELHAGGATLVLVTHEREIARQADRIVTMRDGVIIDDSRTTGGAGAGRRASQRTPLRAKTMGDEPAEVAIPAQAVPSDEEDGGPLAAAQSTEESAVLHPNIKRALMWTFTGPACLMAMYGWARACEWLRGVNPGFVQTVGRAVTILLLALVFVAPILGIIHGRRGARLVRLAPTRFTGLRSALAAQWIAGGYLLLVTGLSVLLVLAFFVQMKLRVGP